MSQRSDAHPRLTRRFIAAKHPGDWFDIGDHTYGDPQVQEAGAERLLIGKYCSIADEVTLILSNHAPFLTTYPFKALDFLWPEARALDIKDHVAPGPLVIGNDVWLGYRSTVLPGVRIGDGAIIGAGAVVTKDVPPYAIMAGVPARIVRFRFADETITALLAIRWWDWSDEKVAANIEHLLSADPTTALARFLDR